MASPLKMRFRKSKLYISALAFFLAALLVCFSHYGVGGGFILVPAMIYLLGMPTCGYWNLLFQIIFVTANITL